MGHLVGHLQSMSTSHNIVGVLSAFFLYKLKVKNADRCSNICCEVSRLTWGKGTHDSIIANLAHCT